MISKKIRLTFFFEREFNVNKTKKKFANFQISQFHCLNFDKLIFSRRNNKNRSKKNSQFMYSINFTFKLFNLISTF